MREDYKENFDKYLEHIGIMEGMKPIEMFPVINVIPISMVATYLEVPQGRISSFYHSNAEIVKRFGSKKLFLSDFVNAGYKVSAFGKKGNHLVEFGDFGMNINNAGARCFSKEAIFFIAMNITGDFPERVRAAVEDIVCCSNTSITNANNCGVETVMNDVNVETAISNHRTVSDNIFSFDNPEFGSIRGLFIDNEPWFIGKDVAQVLGYERPTKAVQDRVDSEDKDEVPIQDSIGRNQNTPIINESGLYSLILSSKLPSAKKFKRWVTSEVLPSLRKNGAYIVGQDQMSETELIARALLATKRIIDEQKVKIQAQTKTIQAQSETIKTFANETNTWDQRSVINALIRSYAANCYNNNFAFAFNDFYKQYDYKYHTKLKARRNQAGGKKAILDCMNQTELQDALKLAISICEAKSIDVAAVINSVNLSVYSV